jgi:hypothetical protein
LQASSEAEVDVRIGRALHAAAWETRGGGQLAAPLLEAVGNGVLERFFIGEDARDFEAANLHELSELARYLSTARSLPQFRLGQLGALR